MRLIPGRGCYEIRRHLEAGGRCLVATTGLNNNEFLLDELPNNALIWLYTDLDTLSERVQKKPFGSGVT